MHDQPIGRRPADLGLLERTIIRELLRDDHEKLWFRAELERAIHDADHLDIVDALQRLRDDGVVCVSGELACVSRCVLHLHALEVLAI